MTLTLDLQDLHCAKLNMLLFSLLAILINLCKRALNDDRVFSTDIASTYAKNATKKRTVFAAVMGFSLPASESSE